MQCTALQSYTTGTDTSATFVPLVTLSIVVGGRREWIKLSRYTCQVHPRQCSFLLCLNTSGSKYPMYVSLCFFFFFFIHATPVRLVVTCLYPNSIMGLKHIGAIDDFPNPHIQPDVWLPSSIRLSDSYGNTGVANPHMPEICTHIPNPTSAFIFQMGIVTKILST